MNTISKTKKWTEEDYGGRRFFDWKPRTPLIYPCSESEKNVLHALKQAFGPLPPYKVLEQQAIENDAIVAINIPVSDGYIVFLENTVEQCTSPQTKHSQGGMQGARHWVQRVDTPEGMFQRLIDGYGISLMFGEREHQFIRNSNNWRGASGITLDIDDWRKPVAPGSVEEMVEELYQDEIEREQIPDLLGIEMGVVTRAINNFLKPEPCFSQQELFDRYPLIPEICSFLIPSATSLHEGRPFKARGIVLFPEPVTDQRVYREIGDRLCEELNCIPQNVTKNPVAVGFGNTHHAPDAWRAAE